MISHDAWGKVFISIGLQYQVPEDISLHTGMCLYTL